MRNALKPCSTKSSLMVLLLMFLSIPSSASEKTEKKEGKSDSEIVWQNQTKTKRITGRVTNKEGEPLPGVNVMEKGTQNGTISNLDGLYTLNVSDKNPQVAFTYIGFNPVTINIGSASVYDIIMEETINEMDELVVVGYSQQRKISSIGSQSSLKVSDIKMPSASLTSALVGRLSGVIAVQRTGEPGKDASDIWIRGYSTPNNSNPLMIVDGVERPFNDIDPGDIESITVLKDASATAVYGVRGANGVVIVKTKPGIIGKPVVNVDYYESFTQFTKQPKFADGITYMNTANEALTTDGLSPMYLPSYIKNTESGMDPLLYPNVDWQKVVFKDWGHQRRVNANIRGGSQMAQFYASISYFNEKGMVRENDYENYNTGINYDRYNFLTNLSMKVTSSTTVDIGAQGHLGNGNYPGVNTESIFSSTIEVNPVLYPVMFRANGVEYVPGLHTQGGNRNPYAEATKTGYRKTMDNKIMANVRLTQDLSMLTEGLKLSVMYAYDVSNRRESSYTKRENTYYFADRTGEPYDAAGNPILKTTWDQGSNALAFSGTFGGYRKDNLEASLNYDRVFGKHRVGAMFVYTQQSKTINDAGDFIGSLPYRLQGIAGRATYSWHDRYFAEFNIGYNGGENFPKSKRFGTFPAFGVGWVLSNEKFWEPIQNVFSFMKVRYTNGRVGSSDVDGAARRFMYIDQYDWAADYGDTFGSNVGVDGVRIKNPATPLTWEIAHKQDLGIDLKFFRDELSVTVDFYKENRKQILLNRTNSLPGFAGFQETPYGNVGKTRTKGYDLSLEYFKQFNKDLALTVRGNFTYTDVVWVDDDTPDKKFPWRNREGHSLKALEGFTANGLYTQQDIDAIKNWLALPEAQRQNTAQPFPTPYKVGLNQVRAGDIKYKDLNGDGTINDDDISWIGNGDIPKINYGFGFNLDYKAFSIGALFQGTAKADRLISGFVHAFNNSSAGNVFSNIDDRWTENNPSQNAFYPRLSYGNDAPGNQNNYVNSTWWLKDMSFFRLKSLQLSYRIPETLCHKLNIKNASVYMMGTNLFTISGWKLWDPELGTNDGNKYPNTTAYTIGLNFSF